MNKEDKICAFCKYHFIEEISFDSPQSCCKKRKATTEKWLKCDDFEYSDKYIEVLQQKVNQLETNRDEAIQKLNKSKEDGWFNLNLTEIEELLSILERGKE